MFGASAQGASLRNLAEKDPPELGSGRRQHSRGGQGREFAKVHAL